MRYSVFVVAAALCALALSACDRPTTVVAPAPVAGPAGPQGATGATECLPLQAQQVQQVQPARPVRRAPKVPRASRAKRVATRSWLFLHPRSADLVPQLVD